MAASSAADIPESKSDYCPCNRCTVARKQGRQEIIDIIRELHKPHTINVSNVERLECLGCFTFESDYFGDEWTNYMPYPCPTIKALDSEQ